LHSPIFSDIGSEAMSKLRARYLRIGTPFYLALALASAACQSTVEDHALAQDADALRLTFNETCVIHITPPGAEALSVVAEVLGTNTAKLTITQTSGTGTFSLDLFDGTNVQSLPVDQDPTVPLFLKFYEASPGNGITVEAGRDYANLTLYPHPVLPTRLDRDNRISVSTETMASEHKLARIHFQEYIVVLGINHTQ
jgi:hypothetical protein